VYHIVDSINEICEEIFHAKHKTAAAVSPKSLDIFSKNVLLQALPLQNDAVKAQILSSIIEEQRRVGELKRRGGSVVDSVSVDVIDTFKRETQAELTAACNQMADAMLARCLIETLSELGQQYDLSKHFQ
jgi:adenosylmethionine-8-amino-7-oxononanoate aminotransferase